LADEKKAAEVSSEDDSDEAETPSQPPESKSPQVSKMPDKELIELFKQDDVLKKGIEKKEIQFTDTGIRFNTPEQLGKIIENIGKQDKSLGKDKLQVDLKLEGDPKDHKKFLDKVVEGAKKAGYSPENIELNLNGKSVDLAKSYGSKAEKTGEKPEVEASAKCLSRISAPLGPSSSTTPKSTTSDSPSPALEDSPSGPKRTGP